MGILANGGGSQGLAQKFAIFTNNDERFSEFIQNSQKHKLNTIAKQKEQSQVWLQNSRISPYFVVILLKYFNIIIFTHK